MREIVFGVSPKMAKHARNFSVVSQKHLGVSLQILSPATKFPRSLNWEKSRAHVPGCRAQHVS